MKMHLSIGWIFLLGGLAGVIQNMRAKTFSWANTDGNMSREDVRKYERPMTPRLRMLAISICLVVALGGVWKIQHDHWWNPFLGHPTNRQLTPHEREDDNKAISMNESKFTTTSRLS